MIILNYVLAILSLFVSALALFYSIPRETKFAKDFTFFSCLFVLFFYVLPFSISSQMGYFIYRNMIYPISTADLSVHLLGISLFILGFSLSSLFLTITKRKSENFEYIRFSNTFIFISAALIIVVCVLGLISNIGQLFLSIRRDEVDINPLFALLLIFVQSLGFCCLFEAERRGSILIFVTFAVSVLFLSVSIGGRVNLLTLIGMLLIFYKFPVKVSIVLSIVFIPLTLPILLNGKVIIAALSTGADLANSFANIYGQSDYLPSISDNFGHVFVSFQVVDSLIEKVGFRYFYDYIHGFMFYLRVLGIQVSDSLTYYNTEILIGERVSIIPTGFLSFGYVQFGFVGIIASGVFYRFIGHFTETLSNKLFFSGRMPGFYLSFIAANTFYVGEVRTIILAFLMPVMFVYLISLVGSKRYTWSSL